MGWEIIVIIVLAVLFVVAAAAALVFRKKYIAEKRRSDESARFAEDVKVRGGVRYSGDDAVEREGAANISLKKGDILLPRGETHSAERGGEIMPGTYTVRITSRSSNSAWAGSCAPIRTAIRSCSPRARRSAPFPAR